MAKKIIETLIDDLDGGPAAETIVFSIDGNSFEIDLSVENAAAFRSALQRYISAGRQRREKLDRTRKIAGTTRGNARELREWARSQGIHLSDRGRVPKSVVEQFQAAMKE